MNIYCLKGFKEEFNKLNRKKSYRNLEEEIINYFFNKPVSKLLSGTRLNNSSDTPYIKKRLKGKGGFRFYFLIIIKDKNLYLMFVHPKSGTYGADNITDESKSSLYKEVLEAIKTKNLLSLTLSQDGNKIVFKDISNSKYISL